MFTILFWRKRVRTDQRWDAGIGVGIRQPGRTAKAKRSLVIAKPREFRVSHGGEARRYAGRRRVAAGGATQSGGGGPLLSRGSKN
jgi:hypothetical protein